jgi:succinate dehydrogenase / fumarate reductase cytochrome b subunit
MRSAADRRHFALRRLHSLSGIIPIGLYLLVHILFENSMVLVSPATWDRMAATIQSVPAPILLAIEVFVLWLPLLFHSLYGLVITRTAQFNFTTYDYPRNYLYTLQRITGVIALAFVLYHVWTTRMQVYLFGADVNFAMMHHTLSNPAIFVWYLVGVTAAVFHFTNGIWSFSITWGLTIGPRSQQRMGALSLVLFVVLTGMAAWILTEFRIAQMPGAAVSSLR